MSRATHYIKRFKVLLIFLTLLKACHQDNVTLTKCCSYGFHLRNTICVPDVVTNGNFSDVTFSTINNESNIIKSDQNFHDVFRLEVSNVSLVPNKLLEKAKLFPEGDLLYENDFIEFSSFCVDYIETSNGSQVPSFWLTERNIEEPTQSKINYFSVCAALVYFFFLASFFWMNVLAFMMWRDNRQILKQVAKISYYRNIVSSRRENRMFRMYCLYAWGIPFVLTIFLIVIDRVNLEHIPWFIKPGIVHNGCFLSGKERLLYLYLPIMIIIISNWIFFILTAFNLWGAFNDTVILAQKRQSLKNRLIVFLKLSILMGISWVLEVISSILPTNTLKPITFIFDLYNAFIGVAFFIVLVCKKRIWAKIFRKRQRISSNNYPDGSHSMRLSTMSSIRK